MGTHGFVIIRFCGEKKPLFPNAVGKKGDHFADYALGGALWAGPFGLCAVCFLV